MILKPNSHKKSESLMKRHGEIESPCLFYFLFTRPETKAIRQPDKNLSFLITHFYATLSWYDNCGV
jgi:hypothetical protein